MAALRDRWIRLLCSIMQSILDDAIVLGRLDYSETSQVLVLFAREHGKIRAIAKGIKRGTKTRFATGIDLLDVGTVVLSVRRERQEGLATLTEWKQTRSLSGLREKLFRLNGAQYVSEITAQLTEDWDPHPELFDALMEGLVSLSDAGEPIGDTVRYQAALLTSIGGMPRLDACMSCHRVDDLVYFSSFQGGLICKHCEAAHVEKRQLSPNLVESLRRVARGGDVGEDGIAVFSLLNYHISHSMGREPRLAQHLVSRDRQRRV